MVGSGRRHPPGSRVVDGSTDDDAVVVADFASAEDAERLAGRLVAAGLGAAVVDGGTAQAMLPPGQPPLGPAVVVRRADHDDAVVLARLFDEVDGGVSLVAPPPLSFWEGPPYRRAIGIGLLGALALCVVILLLAAL